jgi:twitching motility protein PilT
MVIMLPKNVEADQAADQARSILNLVITSDVNDYYIALGRKPFIRRQGFFTEVTGAPVIDQDKMEVILQFLLNSRLEEARNCIANKESFHFSGTLSSALDQIKRECRYRAILVSTLSGPELTVRVLDRNLLDLDKLGLQQKHYDKLVQTLQHTKGLILITGPTGAGKSTTLAAIIQHLIDANPYHVVTLEDPVEFLFAPRLHKGQSAYSMVTQRSVGVDCASYAKGLMDALRMKPEVIAIGEIRDAETMRTVISAAETGHLIIGTMHASSAYQAIDRILAQAGTDSRLVAQMLANNLLCVVAQNLIPARNATEQDPRRVLGYEVLFRTKDLAQLLHHLDNQSVPPARIRELIGSGGGIDWNGCLDELVRKEEIHEEVAAALKSLE